MRNKNLTWGKTLLGVYKYLDIITNSIDELVYKRAHSSFHYNNMYYNSTYNTANKIIELTIRKKKLKEIKILIEDVVAQMKDDDIRIISLLYFDLLKNTTVAQILQVSMRTFFRQKTIALQNFAKVLESLGYNHAKLITMLEDEKWLIELYNKTLVDGRSVKQSSKLSDYKLLKSVIKDLNKTATSNYY